MGNIAGFINDINKFTNTLGTVMGAAEAMTPAIYAVSGAVNQVASVFTEDQYYNPYPQYPTYPTYPPSPIASLEEGKVGVIGNMFAGALAGGITHKETADAIGAIKSGAGMKALGMSTLKAGGIGAAVTGVISAAKNISLVSKGMQTSADAAGNIGADTVGGLLVGATGGLAAGAASMALAKAVPGGGLMLTIGAAVAGAVGGTGAGLAYNMSGLRDGLANGIRSMFGGGNNQNYGYGNPAGYNYQQPYQQPYYGY